MSKRWVDARFAGTKNPTLFAGDVVEVVRGEEKGLVAEVLDVRGHAYSADNRVFIQSQQGEIVYYHPWDVALVRTRVR